MQAGTNGHTQSEAIEWLNDRKGVQIGDGQCPALAKAYYEYLGYEVSGDGKDYEYNVPSGSNWIKTYYYSGYVPEPGDIAVWRKTNTDAGAIHGHVAIVESANSSGMVCYEQGNSAGKKVRTYTYSSYGSVTCFIRPDFVPLPSPIISDNKNYVNVGESITFWYSGLSECSKAEFYFEKKGSVYYTKDSTASTVFTTYFENEGMYKVYAGGYYNGQWYYSSKITVYVFNPKLTCDKTVVNTNEEITFAYSGLSECGNVYICFEKNGNTYYSDDSTSSRVYKNYFENPGEYYVYAKGTLGNYTTTSEKIKIVVSCNHKYSQRIIEATCTEEGYTKYTCSICGSSYKDNYTQTIDHSYQVTSFNNGIAVLTCTCCDEECSDSFAAHINESGYEPLDMNGDGIINAKDYAYLIKNYSDESSQ